MQRRSVAQNEGGPDLESTVSSSQGSINPRSKSGRRSITSAAADRALHDETSSKFFPMITILMELTYSFVKAGSEVYSIYALAGYTSTLSQREAIELMIKYRYIGVLVVLPVGIVCDSYTGTFYPLIIFLFVLTAFMGLHAVISIPWMFVKTDTKLLLAQLTFIIFALFFIVEPLKLVIISRAIMESNYFREPRRFYAMLACALNLGIAAGGTVLYFSRNSRYALCTVMFANFCLMIVHTAFYLVARQQFTSDTSTRTTETFAIVEKALAAIICSPFKYFDRHVLRKMIFKHSSGIAGDFRCFTLSQNTQNNAKAIVGIVLVTLPLTAALTFSVVIDALYYVQASMFYFYPTDPFPFICMKGYFFLLLFPLMEIYIGPSLKKWSGSEASRQLTMVGLGAMCVSIALCWSFGIHRMFTDGKEFWYQLPDGAGHVAVTNCVNEPLYVRSQFMNYIIDDEDGWTLLPPFKTFTVLNVPEEGNTFHFEFSNTKLAMYDEYFLPVRMGQASWYVILPTGVFPYPPHCFRRDPKLVVMSSSFYGPATVCVVCALTLCNGYVRFADFTGLHNAQVNLVPLTGRGTNESTAADKIMTELVGEYNISGILGGVSYTGSNIIGSFSRTDTFMVVVYEGSHYESDWKNDGEVVAHSVEPTDDSDLIKIFFMKTSPKSTFHVEWMYPTAVFQALSEVTYLVSLWMFLFTHTPDQIRTTIFCFIDTLRTPAYVYMYMEGAISFRRIQPIDYFYLATVNCFFIIIYFFCILFFIHKLFKVKPVPSGSAGPTAQRRQYFMPKPSDEEKGK